MPSEEEVECWHVLIEDMSLLRYYFNSIVYYEKNSLCAAPIRRKQRDRRLSGIFELGGSWKITNKPLAGESGSDPARGILNIFFLNQSRISAIVFVC